MKATKTTIQKRLLISNDDYEMMIMQIWLSWCGERSKNRQTLQKVLGNAPLFNWWMAEIRMLEAQFIRETRPFDCPKYAKRMYCEWIIDIFSKFSKPLLKNAKRKQQ